MERSPSGESDTGSPAGASAFGAAIRLPFSFSVCRDHPLSRLLCRSDIKALTLGADGRVTVERAGGSRHDAEVDASTTVFSRLVILRLRCAGRLESLVLPRAATGEDVHRRLRVWLEARAKFSGAA